MTNTIRFPILCYRSC